MLDILNFTVAMLAQGTHCAAASLRAFFRTISIPPTIGCCARAHPAGGGYMTQRRMEFVDASVFGKETCCAASARNLRTRTPTPRPPAPRGWCSSSLVWASLHVNCEEAAAGCHAEKGLGIACQCPHRLVVRTSRRGRGNPGSAPGEDILYSPPNSPETKGRRSGRDAFVISPLWPRATSVRNSAAGN